MKHLPLVVEHQYVVLVAMSKQSIRYVFLDVGCVLVDALLRDQLWVEETHQFS